MTVILEVVILSTIKDTINEKLGPPLPPFDDGINGVFRLWCEFIIESGRWVVLFLILFSPRMLSPDENNQSGWFPKIIYVDVKTMTMYL